MATTRTRYVNTASVGGDGTTNNTSGATAAYASLNAALVGEASDITSATGSDEIVEILCSGTEDSVGYDETSSSWVTSTGNYVHVKANTGQEAVGELDTAKYYRNNEIELDVSLLHLRFTQIQFRISHAGSAWDRAFDVESASGNVELIIDKCTFEATGASDVGTISGVVSDTTSDDHVIHIVNCFFYAHATLWTGAATGHAIRGRVGAGGSVVIHNCTIRDWPGVGIEQSSGTVTARNCLVDGPTTCFSGTITQSYNASSDATASGTGSRTSQTFTWTADNSPELTSGDSGARDFGDDLSGDATLPVTDDIVGTARPQNSVYDIGCWEVVAGGSSAVPIIYQMLAAGS